MLLKLVNREDAASSKEGKEEQNLRLCSCIRQANMNLPSDLVSVSLHNLVLFTRAREFNIYLFIKFSSHVPKPSRSVYGY